MTRRIFHTMLPGFLLLFQFAATAQQTYDEQVEAYINQYKDVAIADMKRTGIPASITLAQGIIESSAGQSPLATEANNHFGIKCHEDWTGATYEYDDDKKNECFRKYNSAAESFDDHSNFLRNKPRYAVLFTYDPNDYKAWAKGLKSCGYATNPQYAQVLIKCIEDYDLHQWDLNDEDRSKWFASINKTDSNKEESAPQEMVKREDVPPVASADSDDSSNRIFSFNDIKCITLLSGESLNDVATDFQISINRLMRYNDLTDATQAHAGDRIYLQPKRKNGDQKFHTVQQGETMFSISRDHGIQLKELYEKNKMILGSQPEPGEVIFLHDTRDDTPHTLDSLTNRITPVEQQVAMNPSYQYHTVSKGDTLFSIAKKYNLTVAELKDMNKLYDDHLIVGQRLQIAKAN